MNSSKKQKKSEILDEFFDELLESTDKEDLEFEKMVINSDFAAIVRDLMELNGMTSQKELAKKIGISAAHLSKVLSSDKYFNIELLAKIQRIFNTKIVLNASALMTHASNTVVTSDYLDALVNSNNLSPFKDFEGGTITFKPDTLKTFYSATA